MAQAGEGDLTFAQMMEQGAAMSDAEKQEEAAAMDGGAFGEFHRSQNKAAEDNALADPQRKGEVYKKEAVPSNQN
ncbi:hypothetical protein HYV31_00145 [candidate division WWE3 bacterium]|nr:hypothetical protein [candidate division WWE3 bacterium]